MIDYERAAINLIETGLPDIEVKCCFFIRSKCLASCRKTDYKQIIEMIPSFHYEFKNSNDIIISFHSRNGHNKCHNTLLAISYYIDNEGPIGIAIKLYRKYIRS